MKSPCIKSHFFLFFFIISLQTIKTLYFPKALMVSWDLSSIRDYGSWTQSLLFELSPPPLLAGLSLGWSWRLIGLCASVQCLPEAPWDLDEPVEGKGMRRLPYHQYQLKVWTTSFIAVPCSAQSGPSLKIK